MKNGQVKHSKDLVDADLDGERKMQELFSRMGIGGGKATTLEELQTKPGFYILFAPKPKSGGSLKGPFNTAEQASEAHREWMWESKHS
jgi:hypothetical protein